ncbi:Threonine efflux protein [Falsiruegeria litorea R37]|uniref:Threonine efflux protein n=1 Tax=Falsiruegeria litorea R37 TaxID=1200284 RepID=A0A1Y5RPF7_9RHOB|nr:LysE family translocator [Falsiruegeria litorea]SLN21992.1 Threonine efflux protein [Falsiruegeria litorea R37]
MITPGFIAIWIAWLLAGGSPGPATMGIAGTAMTEGRRAGLAFALGICAGSAAWGIAAALGLSAIMLANVWVFEVIRYVGVAYLGWLAIKALLRALRSDEVALGNPVKGSLGTIFAKGAAIHLTNPKAILSWGSIYAIVAPNDASLAMLLGYFGMLYAGSLLIFIGYAFLFSSARMVNGYRRARRWFDLAFAGFFGVASYKILTVRLS